MLIIPLITKKCYNEIMEIRENVPIANLTTMRLGGNARYVVGAKTPEDVRAAYIFAKDHNMPVWVMGGGANTIGRDEGFPGVILLNEITGIFIERDGKFVAAENINTDSLDEELILKGMGGEVWDNFVKVACDLDYSGIEALSMIPGTLGAAPVQNIGAYGQEISQVILSVEAYDTKTTEFVTIKKSDMQMSYRSSRFNHGEDAGRFVILSVIVKLHKGELQRPFYNSLERYIEKYHETNFSPNNIRRMICEIRADKLPDPKLVASAGSFFKNVFLNKDESDAAEAKGIPVWRSANGEGKINSGWLIEQCGLKGKEMFGFKVSDKAALVLINKTAKSYHDLDQARQTIIDAVQENFGYILGQEPVEMPILTEVD